jgi:hypothetical protein
LPSFIAKKSTVAFTMTVGDGANPLSLAKIPFHEANFHIYDNDVFYGDGQGMDAIAQAGSVLYYNKGDLSHFFFKNRTAGNVGRVCVVATVVHPETLKELQMV